MRAIMKITIARTRKTQNPPDQILPKKETFLLKLRKS